MLAEMQTESIGRGAGGEGLAEFYRAVLEEQERSGLSVAEVAEVVGVTASTLYQWRRRLSARAAGAGGEEQGLVRVQVVDADREAVRAEPGVGFVVRLTGGRAVEVPTGFNGVELARLVEVLESC